MNVIVYYRVAEPGSRRSRLYLDGQQRDVENWLNREDARILEEVFELERPRMRDRPVLEASLAKARGAHACLLVAMVGDLVTRVEFLRRLAHSGVEIRAADLPAFTEKLVPELLEIADYRRRQVGRRIGWGLDMARRQGRFSPSGGRLSEQAAARGRQCGASERRSAADRFARSHYPRVAALLRAGNSMNGIARLFNEEGVATATGRTGCWTCSTVRNLIRRAERLGLEG
ncbi:MAG: hypothetical protein Tsb0017_05630 [Geothermobacteraceae bacterium]